jgi:hypothetical protein
MGTLYTNLNAVMLARANDSSVTSVIPKRTQFKFNNADEVKSTFQIIADKRENILMSGTRRGRSFDIYILVNRGQEKPVLDL